MNFSKPSSKNVEKAVLIFGSFWTNLENQLQRTAEFVSKALKDLYFVVTVFITAEICAVFTLNIKMLSVNEISACTFISDQMND